ncbi:DedA family protein [Desulfosarcina ovata]|nr:VTT domain-containing protein [Desulfosarcina ovata]
MGAAFFKRHGSKSVLFGRFVGPVRPVIPVVAGMLGMQPRQFFIVNVLLAVGWALAYVLPGVFFGTSPAVAWRCAAGRAKGKGTHRQPDACRHDLFLQPH